LLLTAEKKEDLRVKDETECVESIKAACSVQGETRVVKPPAQPAEASNTLFITFTHNIVVEHF